MQAGGRPEIPKLHLFAEDPRSALTLVSSAQTLCGAERDPGWRAAWKGPQSGQRLLCRQTPRSGHFTQEKGPSRVILWRGAPRQRVWRPRHPWRGFWEQGVGLGCRKGARGQPASRSGQQTAGGAWNLLMLARPCPAHQPCWPCLQAKPTSQGYCCPGGDHCGCREAREPAPVGSGPGHQHYAVTSDGQQDRVALWRPATCWEETREHTPGTGWGVTGLDTPNLSGMGWGAAGCGKQTVQVWDRTLSLTLQGPGGSRGPNSLHHHRSCPGSSHSGALTNSEMSLQAQCPLSTDPT